MGGCASTTRSKRPVADGEYCAGVLRLERGRRDRRTRERAATRTAREDADPEERQTASSTEGRGPGRLSSPRRSGANGSKDARGRRSATDGEETADLDPRSRPSAFRSSGADQQQGPDGRGEPRSRSLPRPRRPLHVGGEAAFFVAGRVFSAMRHSRRKASDARQILRADAGDAGAPASAALNPRRDAAGSLERRGP